MGFVFALTDQVGQSRHHDGVARSADVVEEQHRVHALFDGEFRQRLVEHVVEVTRVNHVDGVVMRRQERGKGVAVGVLDDDDGGIVLDAVVDDGRQRLVAADEAVVLGGGRPANSSLSINADRFFLILPISSRLYPRLSSTSYLSCSNST